MDTSAVQIGAGFALEVESNEHEVTFTARLERFSMNVNVKVPFPPRQSWHREWSPERDQPEYAQVEFYSYQRRMTPEQAVAMSELLALAADYCRRLNDINAEALAHQENEVREFRARAAREEAEEESKRKSVKEEIEWYVGQKFKLRRRGYKATVFGVLDRVSDTTIYTTSERGIPMTTLISELEEFSIKYDGEKRYTKVFPA